MPKQPKHEQPANDPVNDQDHSNLLPEKRTRKGAGPSKIITELGKKYGLNQKQIKFCDLYTNSSEHRGNGLRSYAEAYNINLAKPGSYNVAKANASILLSNEKVLKYLNDIIESSGLNDAFVDTQLHFLIHQNSDLQAKAQGIKIYNDLKNRIEKKQQINAIQFNINLDNTENGTSLTISGTNEDQAA